MEDPGAVTNRAWSGCSSGALAIGTHDRVAGSGGDRSLAGAEAAPVAYPARALAMATGLAIETTDELSGLLGEELFR